MHEPTRIHEFSRGFLNPHFSEKHQRWVSGGFGAAIDADTVPEKIQNSVKQGYFEINDNYPPEIFEDYALIAREIDEYSVLAVATREVDDRGQRPLVAYRYFWLEKPEGKEIDGVGTLLIWWLTIAKEPKFKFTGDESSSQLDYNYLFFTKEVSEQHFEQYNSEALEESLSQIKHYPFAFMTSSNSEFSRRTFHYVALRLQKEYRTPIAWAWNVRFLEHPESFTLIYCADEQSNQRISEHIHKHRRTLISQRQSSHEAEEKETPPSTIGTRAKQDNYPSRTNTMMPMGNNTTWDSIKKLLVNIARDDKKLDESKFFQLVAYLEKYPSQNWNWDAIVDRTLVNNSSAPLNAAQYLGLLVLLGYIKVTDWLDWLRTQNSDQYANASLSVQTQLFQTALRSSHNQAQEQLRKNISLGIIEILLQQLKSDSNNIRVAPERSKYIKWLLVDSKNPWADRFKGYGSEILKKLVRKEQPDQNDEFYQQVFKTWIDREEHKNKHRHYPRHSQYTNLAKIFELINNFGLSAFFYELALETVPAEVYDGDYVKIIPITRNEKSSDQRKEGRNWFPFFSFDDIWRAAIPIFLCLVLLGSVFGSIAYIIITQRQLFSGRSQSNDSVSQQQQLTASKDLEQDMSLYLKNNDQDARKRIIYYFNNGSSNDGSDEITKNNHDFILKEYVALIPNKIKLPIKNGSSSKDIQILQLVLKQTGEDVDVNGKFDNKTQQVINKFSAVGEVDEQTWENIWTQIKEKRFNSVTQFLRTTFQDVQNDQQIKQNIQKLIHCKNKGYVKYADCLNQLLGGGTQ